MKRHLGFPDPLKYTKAKLPPKEWSGNFSIKRARKAVRLAYLSRSREYEISFRQAIEEGKEQLAKGMAILAEKMRNAAKSLFGVGGSFKTNNALRRRRA